MLERANLIFNFIQLRFNAFVILGLEGFHRRAEFVYFHELIRMRLEIFTQGIHSFHDFVTTDRQTFLGHQLFHADTLQFHFLSEPTAPDGLAKRKQMNLQRAKVNIEEQEQINVVKVRPKRAVHDFEVRHAVTDHADVHAWIGAGPRRNAVIHLLDRLADLGRGLVKDSAVNATTGYVL